MRAGIRIFNKVSFYPANCRRVIAIPIWNKKKKKIPSSVVVVMNQEEKRDDPLSVSLAL